MNAWPSLLWRSAHRARMTRIALLVGAAATLCIVLLGAAWLHGSRARFELETERAATESARTAGEALRQLQSEQPAREAAVLRLRGAGFDRPADRVAWSEATSQAAQAWHPLGFSVEVAPESSLPLPADLQAWFDARGLSPPRLVASEMQLRVQGLQEVELLALVESALRAAGGVARLESCELDRRPDGLGLDADCRLRRHALLGVSPAGGPT